MLHRPSGRSDKNDGVRVLIDEAESPVDTAADDAVAVVEASAVGREAAAGLMLDRGDRLPAVGEPLEPELEPQARDDNATRRAKLRRAKRMRQAYVGGRC